MEKEPITFQGIEKLKIELKNLKNIKRPKIIEAIAEARAHGDLKENAEYHAAREEQAKTESRIIEINDLIARANIIDVTELEKGDNVIFGSTVYLINLENKKISVYSFNDFFISISSIGRLLELNVKINNILLNKYNCDGIIVSSPIGSTAYSLSAGGPILDPQVNAFIITPVSPHSLSSRPIVVDDKCIIIAKRNSEYDKVTVFADGQESKKVFKNSDIIIKKSSVSAKFVRVDGEKSYYKQLRNNLGWNK